MISVPGRTSRPSRPRRCSNGADGYGLIRARRSPIRPAWRSEAPGPDEGDPVGGPGEGRHRQAAGRPVRLEAPGERGRHHAQRLGQVVVVATGPRPVGRLDVEGDDHVPVARRIEPLDHRDPEPGRRPPVDVADRVARGVRPDAGEAARILGQPADRPERAGPVAGGLEPADGDRPGPDDQGRRLAPALLRDRLAEQVARRQGHPVEAVDAAPVGPQVDPPGDLLARPQGPVVDQLRADRRRGRPRRRP